MYGKIISIEEIASKINLIKKKYANIVFTNGCFDLLHPGHLEYLDAAKALGDFLIIGVNSDSSVRILKGPNRPINNIGTRSTMLAGLQSVDLVIPFDEETPINLIKLISPNILVKGGDYKVEEIAGSQYILDQGGIVRLIKFKAGYSTTSLIDRIKNNPL